MYSLIYFLTFCSIYLKGKILNMEEIFQKELSRQKVGLYLFLHAQKL